LEEDDAARFEGGVVFQLTRRDELMLEWLAVVRMADMEAIRWALSAFAGSGESGPFGPRKAQQWAARMQDAGLIQRVRPTHRGQSVVWPAHVAIGRAPDLYRQTARHELTVSMVSARFLARGYEWMRDRRPVSLRDHQADGVAVRGGAVELVEVELTPKAPLRYKAIHNDHAERLTSGGVTRVVYLCTADAARIVLREADRYLFRDLRPRLVAVPVFDVGGRWVGPDDGPWAEHLMAPAPTLQVPAPELWREGIA